MMPNFANREWWTVHYGRLAAAVCFMGVSWVLLQPAGLIAENATGKLDQKTVRTTDTNQAMPKEAAQNNVADEYHSRLFIANPDGSNLKQLTVLPDFKAQGSPNWSRDGKWIVFDGE